jgi:ribosomal protein S18 acetylase RimI-like enzyme
MAKLAEFVIDSPQPGDRSGWGVLFKGYRQHYGRPDNPEIADTVWSWLIDGANPFEGCVARTQAGGPIGLIHFRALPRPLAGKIGGYIDDAFVAEEFRGRGVADALFDAVAEIGRERGWSDIRWITSDDNARARAFYDRIANLTAMRTYEIKL